MTSMNWLKKFGCPVGLLLVGTVFGLFLGNKLFHPGCDIKIAASGIEIHCPCKYEIPLSFGRDSSRRSLSSALEIVRDRTLSFQDARVYVDDGILKAQQIADLTVQPPSGEQTSLGVLRQLLADADAWQKLDVCLEPIGGVRVKLRAPP